MVFSKMFEWFSMGFHLVFEDRHAVQPLTPHGEPFAAPEASVKAFVWLVWRTYEQKVELERLRELQERLSSPVLHVVGAEVEAAGPVEPCPSGGSRCFTWMMRPEMQILIRFTGVSP